MLALYIIFGIVAFVFIVLHFFVVADISLSKGKFDIKVKFLFFTIYPQKEKVKNKKAKSRKNINKRIKLEKELEEEKASLEEAIASAGLNPEVSTVDEVISEAKKNFKKEKEAPPKPKEDKDSTGEKEKLSDKIDKLKEIIEKVRLYSPVGIRAFKRLIKAIRLSDLDFYLAVADEDAYECAMKFGKINAIVYNGLALLSLIFRVKVKRIFIDSKFNTPKGDYSLSFKVKIRPSTVIAIGFCGLVNFLYITLKQRKKKKIMETELQKS